MTNYKPGDRVKIYYKSDGTSGMGTIIETDYLDYYGLAIELDEFKDKIWQLDDFRISPVEKVDKVVYTK